MGYQRFLSALTTFETDRLLASTAKRKSYPWVAPKEGMAREQPTTVYTEVQIDEDSISLTLISESGSNGPVIEDTERFTFDELQSLSGEHDTLRLSDETGEAMVELLSTEPDSPNLPEVGDRLKDQNPPSWASDSDYLEVVEVLSEVRADEYVIEGPNAGTALDRDIQRWNDETVADVNPSYDGDEPVVLAIYLDEVPQYSDGTVAGVDDDDVYAFPASRLA